MSGYTRTKPSNKSIKITVKRTAKIRINGGYRHEKTKNKK